jgi:hypothetical protein
VITTTELAHVPGAEEDDVVRLTVVDGRVGPAEGDTTAASGGVGAPGDVPWPEAHAA